MIITLATIMTDSVDDIEEELDDLERNRIEIQDYLETERESLEEIDLQLDSLDTSNPDIQDINEMKYQELKELKLFTNSSIESFENKLQKVNEKIIEIREILLEQKQIMFDEAKSELESFTPSETSYTAPQIQVTPDVIADQRLGTMEKTFRELIVKVLDLREPWTKDKIPSDIIRKVTEQRQKNNILDDVEVPLVNELDFTHYKEIFIYNANWQLFKDIFVDRQGLETKLTELAPIRNIIAHHKRAITEIESKRIDVYFHDIMKMIMQYEGK